MHKYGCLLVCQVVLNLYCSQSAATLYPCYLSSRQISSCYTGYHICIPEPQFIKASLVCQVVLNLYCSQSAARWYPCYLSRLTWVQHRNSLPSSIISVLKVKHYSTYQIKYLPVLQSISQRKRILPKSLQYKLWSVRQTTKSSHLVALQVQHYSCSNSSQASINQMHNSSCTYYQHSCLTSPTLVDKLE